MLSPLLAAAGLFTLTTAYSESITGLSLLGSHFGVPGFNETFDYVVVGGGTAGLTIATRLAEQGNQVAVIEAGGFYEMDNGNLSSVPGDAAYFIGSDPKLKNPFIDWEIRTTPQVGLGGRDVLYTSGKTFGGGSARNYMLYHRGTIGSHKKWADQVGDQSYTWNNILPYFKKSITFRPPRNDLRLANSSVSYQLSPYSILGGPLRVTYPNWANALSSWLILSLKSLGLKEAPDFVSGSLFGYQYAAATMDQDTQTRSSSETSFLRSGIGKNNLVLYPNTLAKKVLFDSTKKATGVSIARDGVSWTLSANKEVIVSAGAFRSPQLLMASGIGPQGTLNKYGIPVVSSRPGVGQNMIDHTIFGVSYAVNLYTHSRLSDPAFSADQLQKYLTQRTGILTSAGADILGWENLPTNLTSSLSSATKTGLSSYPSDWPDIELLFLDGFSGDQKDFLLGSPHDGKQYASASAAIIKPFGRGNVTISSADTAVNPVVNPNLLGDSRDREVAIAAFRRARQIFQTTSIKPIINGAEAYPGANVTTDAQILASLQQQAGVVYHASCTNVMGKATDPMAVVDSNARVFGVSGLRVVDASALPFLPPGHPQATIYMLAEKIAAQINAHD